MLRPICTAGCIHVLAWAWFGALSCSWPAVAEELRVPAFTAYSVPDADALRFSERGGIGGWESPRHTVHWYGEFKRVGEVTVKLNLRLPRTGQTRLRLTLDGQSRDTEATGKADELLTLDFGAFQLSRAGYHDIQLQSLLEEGQDVGAPQTLLLAGAATGDAHFNLKERRNAASVHLAYPVDKQTDVAAFYCEVTAVEDPTTTFYMACGWHRGYFGMQVNSETERRIIFSVWDSGDEAIDRDKVQAENRVTLIDKGAGVYTGDFGNEGTGGHSHLKVMWKTGEPQRFLVTAKPTDETFTIFSGYWFHPVANNWMLISAWKAPKEGGWLRGLHSFSENFSGNSGHLRRKALYGNQWLQTAQGEWRELTVATFSHDPTGKADRLDRFMGVENQQFFLSHGGFREGYTKFGERFERPRSNQSPAEVIEVITRLEPKKN